MMITTYFRRRPGRERLGTTKQTLLMKLVAELVVVELVVEQVVELLVEQVVQLLVEHVVQLLVEQVVELVVELVVKLVVELVVVELVVELVVVELVVVELVVVEMVVKLAVELEEKEERIAERIAVSTVPSRMFQPM
jgi:hypothetical protein